MSIEIAGKDSPQKQRVAWFAIGGAGIAFGLFLVISTLSRVETLGGLALSLLIVVPGFLYVVTGTTLILRVSGKKPDSRISALGALTFSMTAAVGLVGTIGLFFFWVISRSVWLNEGGELSTFPSDGLLVAAGVSAAIALLAVVLTLVSTMIED